MSSSKRAVESTSLLSSVRIENVPQPRPRSWFLRVALSVGVVLLLSAIILSLRASASGEEDAAGAASGSDGVVGSGTGGLVGHLVGGDRDSHGCIPSAGYVWCAPLNKCVRPWLVDKSLGC